MKPISARVTGNDYLKISYYLKEFRISLSDFIRRAIANEFKRMESLSKENKIKEISDNVEWNRVKHSISNK